MAIRPQHLVVLAVALIGLGIVLWCATQLRWDWLPKYQSRLLAGLWQTLLLLFSTAFVGFLLAVPIGLMAGLSKRFNAAINPLVSHKQQQSVLKHIELARREGARVVCGGELLDREGFYVQPTVLADVDHSMSVAREEVFGPVLAVSAFDSEARIIKACLRDKAAIKQFLRPRQVALSVGACERRFGLAAGARIG